MKLLKSYKTRKTAEKDVAKLMSHGIPSIISGHENMPKVFADSEDSNMVDIYVDEKSFSVATIVINDDTPFWYKILLMIFRRRRKKSDGDDVPKEVIKH